MFGLIKSLFSGSTANEELNSALKTLKEISRKEKLDITNGIITLDSAIRLGSRSKNDFIEMSKWCDNNLDLIHKLMNSSFKINQNTFFDLDEPPIKGADKSNWEKWFKKAELRALSLDFFIKEKKPREWYKYLVMIHIEESSSQDAIPKEFIMQAHNILISSRKRSITELLPHHTKLLMSLSEREVLLLKK